MFDRIPLRILDKCLPESQHVTRHFRVTIIITFFKIPGTLTRCIIYDIIHEVIYDSLWSCFALLSLPRLSFVLKIGHQASSRLDFPSVYLSCPFYFLSDFLYFSLQFMSCNLNPLIFHCPSHLSFIWTLNSRL